MPDDNYTLLTISNDDITNEQGLGYKISNDFPFDPKDNADAISDTNSATTTEPTSIPTPFARMVLAQTAFHEAGNKDWKYVPQRYKKIVSECLDVAEILFHCRQYDNSIKIIKWVKPDQQPNENANEFDKALWKFIESDNAIYHFDRMKAIYIITFDGIVIGSTSPLTMFLHVGNDISELGEKIIFENGRRPFAKGSFTPLSLRDDAFKKYLKAMIIKYNKDNPRDVNNPFAQDFKDLYSYINRELNLEGGNHENQENTPYQDIMIKEYVNDVGAINVNSNNDVGAINDNSNNDVGAINDNSNNQNYIKFSEMKLQCLDLDHVQIESDFKIKSTRQKQDNPRLPLVLPIKQGDRHSEGYAKRHYTSQQDLFGYDIDVPYNNQQPLNERTLPERRIKYPYLTIGDFLEDTIIKMPFTLNKGTFKGGKLKELNNEKNSNEKNSFLLPLKSTFFDYFNPEDISMKMESRENTTSDIVTVSVTLTIPTEGGDVQYTKTYQDPVNPGINLGKIITAYFSLGITPNFHFRDNAQAKYLIPFVNRTNRTNTTLTFYNDNEIIGIKTKDYLNSGGLKVCQINSNFDRIKVSVGDVNGYIIPNLQEQSKTNAGRIFKFAIDFGTTNTHIAGEIIGKDNWQEFDSMFVKLHQDYRDDLTTPKLLENFYPCTISFPIRSVLAERKRSQTEPEENQEDDILVDGSILFNYSSYEFGKIDNYLDILPGEKLKWSNENLHTKLFFKHIAFLLRNNVLKEGGVLDQTQIRWFYPESMSEDRRGKLKKAWENIYESFFSKDKIILKNLSEGIAPYRYYKKDGNGVGNGIIATIDIGGGTTDVCVVDNDDPNNNYQMSFRFASNAVFGDGYNEHIQNGVRTNGFVMKYGSNYQKINNNSMQIYPAVQGKGSLELISYFFSLPDPSFLNKLQNDGDLKYVFLLFYSAILYHVAHSMKAKGLNLPRTIAFSGNGSKTLSVISTDDTTRKNFVKTIFEKVYQQEYGGENTFDLKFDNDNPKQATALGGLNDENIPDAPCLIYDRGQLISNNNVKLSDIKISESELKEKIVDEVKAFLQFTKNLNENNTFGNIYGMNVTIINQVFNDWCQENLNDYFESGLHKLQDMLGADNTQGGTLTESMFFFPIVGMLNNVANKIVTQQEQNKNN